MTFMNRHPNFRLILLAAAAGAVFSLLAASSSAQTPADGTAAGSPARPPEDRDQIERRLASVETLIEKSSAASQVEASGKPDAIAARIKARELRKQAETAFKAGNNASASQLLDLAARAMMESVRLAAPEQIIGEKKQRDFDNRMESVKALLGAQKRISAEKRQGEKGTAAIARAEAQMREAAALAAAGKLDQARVLLDQVYVTTKISIENLRDGDTLVRSLQFSSKEEEYHYEVDRNDTHRMLVKVLLDEKRAGNPALEGMVQKYLEQAAALRATADAQAARKDFETAIKTLEDSTKELVRAIRGAGVYIPG